MKKTFLTQIIPFFIYLFLCESMKHCLFLFFSNKTLFCNEKLFSFNFLIALLTTLINVHGLEKLKFDTDLKLEE